MESIERNRELIKKAGGPVAVGRLFNITGQAVSGWYAEGIPADRVLAVAEATKWQVTPHELRPDIYPNSTDGLPADDLRRQGESLTTRPNDGLPAERRAA